MTQRCWTSLEFLVSVHQYVRETRYLSPGLKAEKVHKLHTNTSQNMLSTRFRDRHCQGSDRPVFQGYLVVAGPHDQELT